MEQDQSGFNFVMLIALSLYVYGDGAHNKMVAFISGLLFFMTLSVSLIIELRERGENK